MIKLYYNPRTKILRGEGHQFMIIEKNDKEILMNVRDGHKMILTPLEGAEGLFTFFNRRKEQFKVKLKELEHEALFEQLA